MSCYLSQVLWPSACCDSRVSEFAYLHPFSVTGANCQHLFSMLEHLEVRSGLVLVDETGLILKLGHVLLKYYYRIPVCIMKMR